MTPAEVAFRAGRALQVRAERLGALRTARAPEPQFGQSVHPWLHPPMHAWRATRGNRRIREGALDTRAPARPRRRRAGTASKSGIQAPLVLARRSIIATPTRRGHQTPVGAKPHLQLVTLADTAMSGRQFEELAEQLDSWFARAAWGRTGDPSGRDPPRPAVDCLAAHRRRRLQAVRVAALCGAAAALAALGVRARGVRPRLVLAALLGQ
jgi:hypothetical protein